MFLSASATSMRSWMSHASFERDATRKAKPFSMVYPSLITMSRPKPS